MFGVMMRSGQTRVWKALAMPKSRGRKKSSSHTIKMKPRMRDALMDQSAAFIKKFGREPGPGDLVFFDPDKDVPTPLNLDVETEVLEAMRKACTPPQFVYAYKKTGLLGVGQYMSDW